VRAASDLVNLLAHEFSGLRAGGLAGALVFFRSLNGSLVGHRCSPSKAVSISRMTGIAHRSYNVGLTELIL
jgi:hypothetical protein